MRLDIIIQKLRQGGTRFGTAIGGALELSNVMENSYSIKNEVAFVVPLGDNGSENKNETSVDQVITERFGIIAAIKNDAVSNEETGFNSYSAVHFIRKELFKAILGYMFTYDKEIKQESPIYYRGGSIMGVNRGYLWYQFEFEYKVRIGWSYASPDNITDNGTLTDTWIDGSDGVPINLSTMDDFNTMFAQYVLAPTLLSEEAKTSEVPLTASKTHGEQRLDLTDDPRYGAFSISFSSAFDFREE